MAPCGFVLHCCGLFVPYARILSNFRVGRHPRALSLTICYFVCFRLTSSYFRYLLKPFAYLLSLFCPKRPIAASTPTEAECKQRHRTTRTKLIGY